ncbi:DNA-3-methyladenine glycosylase [Candidatus Saganbacteria bacterium]|nr:DNA-3-methyladenine glycosylase [Candidatus Saganbacteria bacterium]
MIHFVANICKTLKKNFFTRPAPLVARDILGKHIVRNYRDQNIIGKIVEVEVYSGLKDKGSHAFGGKITKRNKIMFNAGGFVYIYLIYGMYWLFNITTGNHGHPEALLIRAVEPIQGFTGRAASGPGKFSKIFKLNKSFYGEDLAISKRLWLEDNLEKIKIKRGPRIGIDYAGPYWSKVNWRFWMKGNKFVSQ